MLDIQLIHNNDEVGIVGSGSSRIELVAIKEKSDVLGRVELRCYNDLKSSDAVFSMVFSPLQIIPICKRVGAIFLFNLM